MEVMEGPCPLFLSAPPRYAPAGWCNPKAFRPGTLCPLPPVTSPDVGWPTLGGWLFRAFCGDAVTAEIIRRYIRYQKRPSDVQLQFVVTSLKAPSYAAGIFTLAKVSRCGTS